MRTAFLALAASTMMLGACAPVDAPVAGTGGGGDLTPEDRAGYVTTAAASDLFEIQSSQIALQKAQRQEIRDFAQMMITHHTQTSAALMAAATSSGMTPPTPALLPMQREMMEELQAASGTGFDRLYVGHQVAAHEMALALHQNYASQGDTPALRTTAAAAAPIVQQHLTSAQQLD